MSTLPIVAVVGATGAQGGSVVRHLSASSKYQVRALTRDPKKAAELSQLPNVDVVEFDYNNPKAMKKALEGGVHAVYGVTNFFDAAVLADPNLEVEQGKGIVDAAVENGVKYFIWSSLPAAHEISKGKYNVAECDNKADIAKYARSKISLKCLFVNPGFYLQNFESMLQTTNEGYALILPMKDDSKPLDYLDVADIGKVVLALLESPDKYVNRDFVATAGASSGKQFAEAFSRVTGKPTTYNEISLEEYAKTMPPHIGPVMATIFQYFMEFGFPDAHDTHAARDELHVKFTSIEEWIAKSKFAVKN